MRERDSGEDSSDCPGPHQGQPVVTAGAPLAAADVAVVLLHGRGATAEGIVRLAESEGLYRHGVTFFAPQAERSRWYPHSFLAPVERNEPHLSSALALVDEVLDDVVEKGIPLDRTVLFGFSQGACLTAEYAARNPRRYGGVAALSGGLIGAPGDLGEYESTGDPMRGTPVFLGCGDEDQHVPVERVHETAGVFRALGADVTERIYDGRGHEITGDETDAVASVLDDLLEAEM